MARLDRLIPVKEIAQIGAALGREFSYEMLAAVAPRSGAELDDALERLTRSGLIFRRGTPPDATYVFKHALVQDAAYESLLVRTRQELHGKIARVLEQQFPATRQSQPELLAHHFTAHLLREPERLLTYVEEGIELARSHRLPFFSEVVGALWKAAAWLQLGHTSEGLDLLRAALDRWMALGGRAGVPAWRSMLAEGVAQHGDSEEALRLLEECFTQIEHPGWDERYYLAEVLRIKGVLLKQQGKPDEGEEALHAAIEAAREQKAKSWELRAATTLATLMNEQGRRRQALDLLRPVYDWFTEGFDTKDLVEANASLEELSR
jgi:tetratricopeptide (TPR) repeat protein